MADWIIKGARVIDPAAGTDEKRDIYIEGTRIGEPCKADSSITARVIDASGMIATPGLIDFHAHVFNTGSTISVDPDLMLSHGVTTVVDAGTAGCAGFEAFERSVISQSAARVRAFLNVYSGGQADASLIENYDPSLYDRKAILKILDSFGDHILGLKIRVSNGIIERDSVSRYLNACIDLANELEEKTRQHLRVCVHTTDSPVPQEKLAAYLRPGDIFCHCYQGAGNTIIDESGIVLPGILSARNRGVIFDAANGRSNFSIDTAQKALADGFLADIISSDITASTFLTSPYVSSLPHVLSKYLKLGLGLPEVISRCTEIPARIMGLEGEIGTLRSGACADIALFRLEDKEWEQKDFRGDTIRCEKLLVPQMTFRAGEVKYSQI